jgi:hypothetical protein
MRRTVVIALALALAASCSTAAAPPPIMHTANGPAESPVAPPPRSPQAPEPPPGECIDTPATASLRIPPGFSPIVTRHIINGPLLGTLEPNDVKRTVMARRPMYDACYRAYLDREPAGAALGTRVHFSIRLDGSVHELETEGVDAALDRCVCSVVARLRFAPQGGNTEVGVAYPFNFVTTP